MLFKKITYVPTDTPDNTSNTLSLALKLAKIKGYNEKNEISGTDGRFIPNSNIVNQIQTVLSEKGQILDSFIRLLNKAGVDPTLLKNNEAKKRLAEVKTKVKATRKQAKKKHNEKRKKPFVDWHSYSESD